MLKINNINIRKMRAISSKLTIKQPIKSLTKLTKLNNIVTDVVLVSLLTLNIFHTIFLCSYC